MIHLITKPTALDRGTLEPGLHELTLAEAESAYIRGTARPATAAEVAGSLGRLDELTRAPDDTETLETAAAAPAPERATARRRSLAPATA